MAQHIDISKIQDYLFGNVSEEECFEVDVHVAHCAQCMAQLKAFRRLRHDLDSVWKSWTAKAHGEAYWKVRLARALEEAASVAKSKGVLQRLKRWMAAAEEKAEAVLAIVLERPAAGGRVLVEGLDELHRHGSRLQFAVVPAVRGVRGDEREEEKERVVVEAREPIYARISVDPRNQRVSVQLRPAGKATPRPLAILVPRIEKQQPRLALFQRVREADFLLAQFMKVPVGEYVLFIEAVCQGV